ncbi:MAG: hypothetical protein HRF40_07390, partial [Nitrososphaera sp.]
MTEVEDAISNLKSMGLQQHPDKVKSWDTWRMISIITKNVSKEASVLDVGCNGSPILPFLKKLGYRNLYGCDLELKANTAGKMIARFAKKERQIVIDMLNDKGLNLSV